MKRLAIVIAALLVSTAALGQIWVPPNSGGGVINVGAAFGPAEPYINTLVGGILSTLFGWVMWLVKTKTGLSIEDSARDALHTWLLRQASSLVAAGEAKIDGLKITVASPALANVANLALKEIPDTVARFGLTPDTLSAMVIDKIPHVPTVAAQVAATVKPTVVPPLTLKQA